MTSLLEARGVALHGRLKLTDLVCASGELTAVIGSNGAGKTSLLKALASIERDEGRVLVDGEAVEDAPPARRMRLLSFLPATRSLIWPIAARDVISLGLPSPDDGRVDELIAQLELGLLAGRPVNHLSTGERSRVLMARTLAARPRLLLLDEPLSNLDPYWVLRTLEILRSETVQARCAVLASVHDLSQVNAFDRVLLVDDGKIVADGESTDVVNSSQLARAFRIEKAEQGWKIREET